MSEDPQAFQLVSRSLLDKIDRLFACKVGEHVDLPQLVVVGDQSSGKSSILEALTGMPFPRDSQLCTRFATQIAFRRSDESSINAFIIPSRNSSPEHIEKLQGWKRADIKTLDASVFADIMREATDLMGIDSPDGNAKTFSEDVLRLELLGRAQEHFSVIDVPGIFKKRTQGVTSKEDMNMVDEMVHGYMKNPRSVILAVVPCNVDVAMQEILERAEELDPEGIRTLGVLTKPDLVDRGTERIIVDMVEGERHPLQLGWHLLRNPGQADQLSTAAERLRFENDFFQTKAPWNDLDKDKVGTTSLRGRLQDILADHIRREFPKVRAEITQKLKVAETGLAALGPKRQTHLEYAQYTTDIAMKFQELVGYAVSANYGCSDLFDEEESLRLATVMVNRGDRFSKDMWSHGHLFSFDFDPDASTPSWDLSSMKLENRKDIPIRTGVSCPELQDILAEDKDVASAKQFGILAWLKEVYSTSRGFGLGTFEASLLVVTMKQQASKWADLALGYVSDVIALVHAFVVRVLHHVGADERVAQGVEALLADKLRIKYGKALEHTRFLINVELGGIPATHNRTFSETLQESRQTRLRGDLAPRVLNGCSHGEVVKLDDIVKAQPLGNLNHEIHEIHDILRSYYELALNRFVDNVRMQVCDFFLVTGPETPLSLFSPSFVSALPLAQLEQLAVEDVTVRNRRARLEKEIYQLREGKQILF